MNDRQRRFAELVVQGRPAGRAYEEAGYKQRGASADVSGCQLLRKPKVKAYMEEMRTKAKEKAEFGLEEKRKWLIGAITTPLSEIREESEYCHSITVCADGMGIIKKVDPLRAMDMLTKLDGDYAADKHEHHHEHEHRTRLVELLDGAQRDLKGERERVRN